MKKTNYMPYNINLKYEWETYKHIGKDYGNSRIANIGMRANFLRYVRRITNRDEKNYKFCNKYSEWEEHVRYILNRKINNYNDMIHWIVKKQRISQYILTILKAIVIPIYIAIFSLSDTLGANEIYEEFLIYYGMQAAHMARTMTYLLIVVLISIIAITLLDNELLKVDFYKDLIDIANKIMSEKSC